MQRMDALLDDICAAQRAQILATSPPDLSPEDSCLRTEISPGCRVKMGDDVRVNDVVCRVICPYHMAGWFYGLVIDGMLLVPTPFESNQITDRAPADPLEEPLPIFAEVP